MNISQAITLFLFACFYALMFAAGIEEHRKCIENGGSTPECGLLVRQQRALLMQRGQSE